MTDEAYEVLVYLAGPRKSRTPAPSALANRHGIRLKIQGPEESFDSYIAELN